MVGMSNYIQFVLWDVIIHLCQKVNGGLSKFRAWMGDYPSLCYVDTITYPCLDLDTGLANLC